MNTTFRKASTIFRTTRLSRGHGGLSSQVLVLDRVWGHCLGAAVVVYLRAFVVCPRRASVPARPNEVTSEHSTRPRGSCGDARPTKRMPCGVTTSAARKVGWASPVKAFSTLLCIQGLRWVAAASVSLPMASGSGPTPSASFASFAGCACRCHPLLLTLTGIGYRTFPFGAAAAQRRRWTSTRQTKANRQGRGKMRVKAGHFGAEIRPKGRIPVTVRPEDYRPRDRWRPGPNCKEHSDAQSCS
jgi:hypothetical protein